MMAAAAKKVVTVIPQRIQPLTHNPLHSLVRKKVAGYARVSTDSDEQENSYSAQVDYFTGYIQARKDWEFVGIYTDEGITGTNTTHRDGFNRMIKDALAGKIDLIVTKSVSRFARNTVDTLTTIRQLKEHGVEVFFQKENIYTFDSKGELLLTIMSSLAQEESRSISENVTWGKRKSFADGKISMPYKSFLGYQRGEDNLPEIVEDEARVIRKIYNWFMEGATVHQIAKHLTETGIKTPTGTNQWPDSTVKSILRNEKYMGDAILQKTFCTDFLTKKYKKNEGEVPQYYVKNSHPAIISKELFELVQLEMKERERAGNRYSGKSLFASKIVCGQCGGYYGSKVWHSTDAYRRVIWRCNRKYEKGVASEQRCTTPHVTDEQIKAGCLKAIQRMIANKAMVIVNCQEMIESMLATDEQEKQVAALQDQAMGLAERIRSLVTECTQQPKDKDEFHAEYDCLSQQYEKLMHKIEAIQRAMTDKTQRAEQISAFLHMLREQEVCTEFDPMLFTGLIDQIVVLGDKKHFDLKFVFRDGTECVVASEDLN